MKFSSLRVVWVAFVITLFVGCSGGGTQDNKEGALPSVSVSQLTARSFSVKEDSDFYKISSDSDVAGAWYSCPSSTEGTVECDLPMVISIEFRDDAAKTLIIRFSNEDLKVGTWIHIDPNIVVSTFNGYQTFWTVEIDGDTIAMNYTGTSKPTAPSTTAGGGSSDTTTSSDDAGSDTSESISE